MQWPRIDRNGRVNHLRVGQEVKETTKVLSAEPKVVRRTGEEMIVVGVEKVFGNEDGVALVDRRYFFPQSLPYSPASVLYSVHCSFSPSPSPSSVQCTVYMLSLLVRHLSYFPSISARYTCCVTVGILTL